MNKIAMFAGIGVLSFSSFALAQDAGAEEGALDDPGGWSGNIELGYKTTTGNSEENVLTYRQKIIFDSTRWTNTITLSADNTTSDNNRTQERYYVTEQLDYNFTAASYGFLRGTYDKNLFSGFTYQATTVVGYGHKILDTDTLGFKIEVGTGGSFEEVENSNDARQAVLGFFSDDFVWKFSKAAELGQSASVEYSTINTITRAQVYIQSQMLESLALKLSYGAKYTSTVPSDRENLDTELLATVVFTY